MVEQQLRSSVMKLLNNAQPACMTAIRKFYEQRINVNSIEVSLKSSIKKQLFLFRDPFAGRQMGKFNYFKISIVS